MNKPTTEHNTNENDNIIKNEFMNIIKSLGYNIEARNNTKGLNRLYLMEDDQRIKFGYIEFYSNRESIAVVNEKLAGTKNFNDGSNLANGLRDLAIVAMAHTAVTNKERLTDHMKETIKGFGPNSEQKFCNALEVFGSSKVTYDLNNKQDISKPQLNKFKP